MDYLGLIIIYVMRLNLHNISASLSACLPA